MSSGENQTELCVFGSLFQPLDVFALKYSTLFEVVFVFSLIIASTSVRTHNLNMFLFCFSFFFRYKWAYSSECFIWRFCVRYPYFRNDKTPNEYSNLFIFFLFVLFVGRLWMTSRRCSHLEVNISKRTGEWKKNLNAPHIFVPNTFFSFLCFVHRSFASFLISTNLVVAILCILIYVKFVVFFLSLSLHFHLCCVSASGACSRPLSWAFTSEMMWFSDFKCWYPTDKTMKTKMTTTTAAKNAGEKRE